MRTARILVAGIVPVLWLILAAVFQNGLGRFSPIDPEYYYLLSSLDLAELRSIGMFQHPGTTVETFGAVMMRAAHVLRPTAAGLQTAVLGDPESYLAILYAGSAVLIALGLLGIGVAALVATKHTWVAIWLQASVFLAPVVVQESASRFKAEPFVLLASLFFIAATLAFVCSPDPTRRRYAVWFGIICGFGLATKFTFAPIVVAPLLMLTGIRPKAWFTAATMVSTIVFTLPIANSYPKLVRWMYSVSSHTGLYGEGAPGLIDVASYREGMVALFERNVGFDVVVLAGVAIATAVLWWAGDRRRAWMQDRELRALIAIVVAQIIGFLLAAKYGTFLTSRYLLGSASLLGVTLWLTGRVLRKRELAWPHGLKRAIIVALSLAAVGIAVNTAAQNRFHLAGWRVAASSLRAQEQRLSVLDGWQFRDYACVYDLANGGRILGLFQASFYSVSQVDALARVYPRTYFCGVDCTVDDWDTKMYLGLHHTQRFSGAEIAASSGGKVVLIYGSPPQIHVVGNGGEP